MPHRMKLFYIASEIEEDEHPCRRDIFVIRGKKGGDK
jgi:hypothetical protein